MLKMFNHSTEILFYKIIYTYRYNQFCPPAFRIDPAYLWGFVYFRQVRDTNLRRGYFQKVKENHNIIY